MSKVEIDNFAVWQTQIRMEYNSLRNTADTVEAGLVEEADKLDEWVQSQTERMSDSNKVNFLKFMAADYRDLSSEVPQIVRRSMFLSCFSLFEYSLFVICLWTHRYGLNGKEPKEFGFKMGRAKTYLKKAKVPESCFGDGWATMDTLKLLRHKCIHSNGLITGMHSDKIAPFIKETSTLSINNSDRIQMTSDFMPCVIHLSMKTLDSILSNLRERVEGKKRKSKDVAKKSKRRKAGR